MKVAIVGAGVSGLSMYLQLRKVKWLGEDLEVSVYESHAAPGILASRFTEGRLSDSAAVVGNNIGLPPQSLQLLRYIDHTLYNLLSARGFHNETYKFCTARGHKIATTPTAVAKDDLERTVTCPRQVLCECLLEATGPNVIDYREVVEVDLSNDETILSFSDGSTATADLVIGADGARSVVKDALFQKDQKSRYDVEYEGICGVGGFIDMELPSAISAQQSMVFTLGPTGSFGYCAVAPAEREKVGWWFNWGVPGLPSNNIIGEEEVREMLHDRVGDWHDPVIQTIVSRFHTNRIYPIWTTPDLPRWGNSKAILLGDAAHTVQATSGLGASLALEDSVVVSLLLAHYLNRPEQFSVAEASERAAQGLYNIQRPKALLVKTQARRRFIAKTRIRAILVEYLLYCYLYLWTNYSIFTQMILGGVETRASGEILEEEVNNYLQQDSH